MKNISFEKKPLAIEIQTVSFCNSGCIICPYRSVAGKLPHGRMSMDLFMRILDQVEDNKAIRIIPYFNNEPFLDPLIFKRLRYICTTHPSVEIELSTNVSRLNEKYQNELAAYHIHDLRLSVFGFTDETHKKVMPGLNWKEVQNNLSLLIKNKALRSNVDNISIVMIDFPGLTKKDIFLAEKFCKESSLNFEFWGFMDRSGNVENFSNQINKKEVFGCEQNRPLERLHINFQGDVVLCCMDWKWKHKLGNLKRNSIDEIWNSSKYKEYRNAIYNNGSDKYTDLCKKCKLAL